MSEMTQIIPASLKTMRDITGTLEEPGGGDNPVILGWADEIASRFPEMRLYCAQYTHDSIPWCGLTVGYVMAHNGIKPIFGPEDTDKFLWARAWSQFGTKVDPGHEQPGDVLVFSGHVTMYDGEEGEYYSCRGGNQSDSVRVSHMLKSSAIAIRRAPGVSIAVAQPPKPPISTSSKPRFTNITATVFGGSEDPNTSAYDNHTIDDDEMGVALPARFTGPRPRVRVFNGSHSVDCTIVDVGPWNTNDKYWESNARPQAESGRDLTGRPTNKAGIDLTPAAAAMLNLEGKGVIDWMFIPAATTNTKKEETVVRDASRKMQLFSKIRLAMKAVITAVAGLFSMDNFGLLNSWLGIGNGAIPITTLFTLAVGGVGIWVLVNVLDNMSMEDFKAGRWMPSELAGANPLTLPPVTPVETPAASTQPILTQQEPAIAQPEPPKVG